MEKTLSKLRQLKETQTDKYKVTIMEVNDNNNNNDMRSTWIKYINANKKF